ncbi:hypothetical protein DFH29DRAFT_550630 [Suillus ampliporus]|nr:hypothetical protein DFH29DRAFT_550630 [Suillus ampliporus]
MKFTSVVTLLSAFTLPAFVESVFVVQDAKYSNPNTSLSTGICSVLTQQYANFSSLPSFPSIGGIPGVHWDSTLCGSCWSLTSTPPCSSTTIYFTVVDDDYEDVVDGNYEDAVDASSNVDARAVPIVYAISQAAFGNLTHASCKADVVYAEATQVDASMCGM